MRVPIFLAVLPLLLPLALPLPATAQPAAAAADAVTRDTEPGRHHQRIEHIRIEDAGSRVDEVRTGGETQSITVTPKAPVPAYEVRPADVTRPASPEAGPGSAGPRSWKVLSF